MTDIEKLRAMIASHHRIVFSAEQGSPRSRTSLIFAERMAFTGRKRTSRGRRRKCFLTISMRSIPWNFSPCISSSQKPC